jgi:hypothetical protein
MNIKTIRCIQSKNIKFILMELINQKFALNSMIKDRHEQLEMPLCKYPNLNIIGNATHVTVEFLNENGNDSKIIP